MGFKVYDFIDLKIKQDDIAKFSEIDLRFIASSSLAANDISVFMKLLIGYLHNEVKDFDLSQVLAIHSLVLRRNLSAKIYEFIGVFSAYGKRLLKTANDSDKEFSIVISAQVEAWKAAEGYKHAEKLRNKVTNHYVAENVHKAAKKFSENHRFSMLSCPQFANSYYPIGEELCHLYDIEAEESIGITMQQADQWIQLMCADLNRTHHKVLKYIFDKHLHLTADKNTKFVENSLVCDIETKLPLLYFPASSTRF